jgi:hypothetical protein
MLSKHDGRVVEGSPAVSFDKIRRADRLDGCEFYTTWVIMSSVIETANTY